MKKYILLLSAFAFLASASFSHAQTLWKNPTKQKPMTVRFGQSYTVTGTVRIQKIYGPNGTVFPSVLLPDRPLRVDTTGELKQPAIDENPMRMVVMHPTPKIASTLEKAEGKRVEVTFRLTMPAPVIFDGVDIYVEKLTFLPDKVK